MQQIDEIKHMITCLSYVVQHVHQLHVTCLFCNYHTAVAHIAASFRSRNVLSYSVRHETSDVF